MKLSVLHCLLTIVVICFVADLIQTPSNKKTCLLFSFFSKIIPPRWGLLHNTVDSCRHTLCSRKQSCCNCKKWSSKRTIHFLTFRDGLVKRIHFNFRLVCDQLFHYHCICVSLHVVLWLFWDSPKRQSINGSSFIKLVSTNRCSVQAWV